MTMLQQLTTTPAAAPATGTIPYDVTAAWNTPISATPTIDPLSSTFITSIIDNGLLLTSDIDQYAVTIYAVTAATPLKTVTGTGFFSSYDAGDNSRVGHGTPWTASAPIPDGANGGQGTDGQMVLYDATAGVEWGFWRFHNTAGVYTCTNAYRYHTGTGYYGRFADGLSGRGAGTPYLAGLVRPWECAQGHIDHALAFAYKYAAPNFRYPASKSDGLGVTGTDIPEGARIQLDPTLTQANLAALGLNPTAIIIAQALQTYGMYTIDNSGSSKVYLEDSITGAWSPDVTRTMLSPIPFSSMRVVTYP